MTTRRILTRAPEGDVQQAMEEGWQPVYISQDLALRGPGGEMIPTYLVVFDLPQAQPAEGYEQAIVAEFLQSVNPQALEDAIAKRSPAPVGQSAIAELLALLNMVDPVGLDISERMTEAGPIS